MRISHSHPGKFFEKDESPYITITMQWSEAEDYVLEYEDVMKMFENGTIHHKVYEELRQIMKGHNNE